MSKKEPIIEENKSSFAEWCHMTGWHGILDFYTAKYLIIKLGWLSIVLTGLFLAVNQSYSLIKDFVSSDQWVTSITYESPKNGSNVWPNLTICGLIWPGVNTFDSELPLENLDAMSTIFGRNEKEQAESLSRYEKFEEEKAKSLDEIFSKLTEAITGAEFNQREFDADLCDKLVVHCGSIVKFNLTKQAQCCSGQSTRQNQTSCFQIFPSETFNASAHGGYVTGHKSGIYYIFKPQLDDYFGDMLFPGTGLEVKLFVGHSILADDYSSKFLLEPGTHNAIAMTFEEHRTKMRGGDIKFHNPNPHYFCNKPYKHLHLSIYSKSLCEYDCIIQTQLEFFKCYDGPIGDCGLINLEGRGECNISETRSHKDFYENLQQDSDNDVNNLFGEFIRNCTRQCPEVCEYNRIDAKVSNALFLAPHKVKPFTKYLNKAMSTNKSNWTNFTEDQVRQLIMLELYYEQKQNRVIERVARLSIEELISNIGGCMGVWSGISLISIVQIFFYIFQVIGNCACAFKSKMRFGNCKCKL